MEADLAEFDRLRRQAEAARRKADQDAGRLEQLLAQLKAEHGAGSLAEGKALLGQLKEEERAAARAFRAGLRAFQEEHGDQLGED